MRRTQTPRFERFLARYMPKWAYSRAQYRFAYDIIDGHRLRRKRSYSNKSGDQELTETNLDYLRQINRDLCTNNPVMSGIFRKLATNIAGSSTRVQARSSDPGWNSEAEAAFREEMIDNPCDVTGRFNYHALLNKGYYRYSQDGDCFCVFTDDGPQMLQGECCGTPYGNSVEISGENFTVTNGVAVSNRTGRVIGYYIGRPNKWGYIQPSDYKKYRADAVQHMANFQRFDHSRGEPILTPALKYVDLLFGYVDAEVVAAKVNACFPIVSKTFDGKGLTGSLGTLESEYGSNQQDDYDRTKVKVEPGQIWEGEPGEKLEALGAARPAQAFDSFTMRMLMFLGNPVCLPLMLTTGDFSHATFMNSRFAYREAQSFWVDEQEFVLKPLARKLWLWKIKQKIDSGELKGAPDDWYKHQVYLKRWPYVDPFREAQADKLRLEDGTITRQIIVSRQDGLDWKEEIYPQWQEERETISASAPIPANNGGSSNGSDNEN